MSRIMPMRVAVLSLGAFIAAAFAGSVQARAPHQAAGQAHYSNVEVSHDSYPIHAEPSMAVNPRNPRNLLGSAMFEAAHAIGTGTFYSFDGGHTWHDNGPLAPPGGMTWVGDTTSAFDPQGIGFVSATVTSFGNASQRARASWGVYVWRTNDGGRTFGRPVAVVQNTKADHPGMAIAPDSGNLFVAWRDIGTNALAFSRSTDGGLHFAHPRFLSTSRETITSLPIVAAGPHGEVAVAYELDFGQPWTLIQVLVSVDGGRTFSRSTVGKASEQVAPAPNVLVPSPVCIAIDPHDGSIDVTYSAYQPGAPDPAVVVGRSSNRGRSWNHPVTVSGNASGAAFQPRVAIDGSGGLDVSYLVLARGRVNLFASRSSDQGAHFVTPRRVTSRSFDPALGVKTNSKQGAWWIGDYQGLAAGASTIYPFWSDTRTRRLQIFTAAVPIATLR